jgi:hypothetical protein
LPFRHNSGLTIVVSGMIAADPGQGGAAWAVLQYVLGLQRLGHDVVLIEPIPAVKLMPAGSPLEASQNARYFGSVVSRFGLEARAALLVAGTTETVGVPYAELAPLARRADVLLNVSGMLRDRELVGAIPRRVYLDLDPGFNQLWHATQGIDMRFDGHTHFVSVGLAVGSERCRVPTCGREWITTVPPVDLDHWRAAPGDAAAPVTTVANWRGYGSITHEGVQYGQKAHSLRPMIDLPRRVPSERFQLALAIDRAEVADVAALAANGWEIVDPAEVASTPDRYRRFIGESKAEFGVAKSGYVVSRSGWFSDRSACYLASGRPVLAQDTGWSAYLPAGDGLLAFDTVEGASDAARAIAGDYERHSRAARGVAESCFDARVVLQALLTRIGAQ